MTNSVWDLVCITLLTMTCIRSAKTGFLCAHEMRSPGESEDKIPSNSTPVGSCTRIVKRLLV